MPWSLPPWYILSSVMSGFFRASGDVAIPAGMIRDSRARVLAAPAEAAEAAVLIVNAVARVVKMNSNGIKKLSALEPGDKGRIISCENDPEVSIRLNHLGLVTGAVVNVYTGSEASNYLVGVNNTRIGLEARLADAITIQQL